MDYTPPKMNFKFPLYKGLKGPLVSDLQSWLEDIVDWFPYMPKVDKPVPQTGEFDETTKNYVKAFQKFCGLPQSGVYTMETHGYMEWKYDNFVKGYAVRWKKQAEEEAKKAEEAKKKKTQKMAPKIPTAKSADPFATRHWTK